MASIPPTRTSSPQLAAIVSSLPMPRTGSPTLGDGSPAPYDPGAPNVVIGGNVDPDFEVATPSAATGGIATGGGGGTATTTSLATVLGGGGEAPGAGAQPAAPGAVQPATPASNLPPASPPVGPPAVTGTPGATTPTAATPAAVVAPVAGATASAPTAPAAGAAPTATAENVSGFGRQNKSVRLQARVGGNATFSFPSFNSTRRTLRAPAISWGAGWTRVQKDGLWYMQHRNGTKAVPAVEYRITPTPQDGAQAIRVANGWGKKFPDGSILVFDRQEGPYRLMPDGRKQKVGLGTHTFGGVKVRIFEASVVRTLEPNGAVTVFDSRGNMGAGTPRGRIPGEPMAAAGGGASLVSAPGKGSTDGAGPGSGPSKGGGPTKGGGPATPMTPEQLTAHVTELATIARGLLQQVQAGTLDPTALASLQAQLGKLPAGLLQAVGAAGTMTGDGSDFAKLIARQPAPGSLVAGASDDGEHDDHPPTTPPPAPVTGVSTSGGGTSLPTPGKDANSPIVKVAAGASYAGSFTVPEQFAGKRLRFAQLPEDVQAAIAAAMGSDQGSRALRPDTVIKLSANRVTLPDGGTLYARHVAQVRGAGPGEDIAMTMRPNRQPGSTGAGPSDAGAGSASGGGGSVSGGGSVAGSGSTPRPTAPSAPRPTAPVASGSGTARPRIALFSPGATIDVAGIGNVTGTFTWSSLTPSLRSTIQRWIATHPGSAAAKALASRTGTGWSYDPKASIVIAAGTVSFPDGLAISRGTTAAAPRPPAPTGTGGTVTGGGPTVTPPRPPGTGATVSGGGPTAPTTPAGGGPGGVNPQAPPPLPPVNDPGEDVLMPVGDGHDHVH